jgi:5'-nucleotidase
MSPRRILATLATLASLAVVLTGLQVAVSQIASANTAGTAIVINEVYGGGGNASAPYNQDFVELYNPTSSAVSVAGMSVQYRSSTGTANPSGVIPLTGSIASHGYYLVGGATGATGVAIPTPDASGTGVNLSATAGTVFLANQTTALTAPPIGSITSNSAIIDLVGFGSSNTFETAATAAPSNTTSVSRNATTHVDTNNNSADFAPGAPTPLNSATAAPTPLALASITDRAGFRNTPIAPITLSASGGTAPYTYSLTGDNGSGLGVSSAGVISGIPSAAGTYHLTAKVTDSASSPASVTRTFALTVTDGDTANHVVIGEVWGDGGFGSATYKNSFIELYNPTDNNVDLSGDSIAYLASNNTGNTGTPAATQQTPLTGTIPAHGFYLVAGVSSNGGAAGVDLPAPDDYSTINWHYADGTLALINTQDPFTMPTGDLTGAPHVIDALGYGVSTSFTPFAYEGAITGFITGTNIAAQRTPIGTDTNNNHTDFASIAPIAINSNGDTQPALSLAGITDQTALVNTASTIATLQATGGVGAITYSITGQPSGITVNANTGVISGTPSASGVSTIKATATDSLNDKASVTFKLTVGSFLVTNPGDQTLAVSSPADIQLTASPVTAQGYGFVVKAGSTLPAGLALNTSTGEITGTPTTTQAATPVTITVTNKADSTTVDVTFNITVTNSVMSIASIQGTAPRSTYAPATGTGAGQTVSTQGVVTAVWSKGYAGTGTSATLGAANSGLSGFVIQTPDANVATSPASEAIFVFVPGTSFTGKDAGGAPIAVGDSVRVSGTVSEYKAASAVSNESATEITSSVANTHKLGSSLGTVTVQTALPATYTDREAHEWEAYAPTDTVITDTYQYETDGELGVASGNRPLVQPTEICGDTGSASDNTCIQNAEQDIVNRGYFLGDGTNTFFTSSSTHYNPSKSGNSAIPLPFMDATHAVRVGAHVAAATGQQLILGFWPDLSSTSASRAGKWYLQPDRAVLGTPVSSTDQGTPDLGTDVVSFENTRADNATPDPSNINHTGTSNIRVATFNVENYFTETGEAFASDNPAIGNAAAGVTSSTTKGCQYDYDRDGNRTLTYQCVSPFGQANAWDPVSGTPTSYKAGVMNAPRGAARQEDLDRQTAKIVTAINGLGGIDTHAVNHGSGADIISLEEIENPNRLKQGITNSPLSPDLSNLKDQGQGTPIANRDAALKYLVDKLNAAAGSDVWGYVKSPEEATDATSMVHLCSILRGDGVTPIDGNAASLANAACSYSSMQDVIRPAFIYKKATIVPVGPADIDFPANPLSPDNPGNNAQPTYNGASPFDIAREPLAQFFKPVGYPNSAGFAVIVNHFKSKGGTTTSDDPGITVTGDNKSDPLVGAYNQARVKQGQELVRFANQFAAKWHTDKVLMVGDFNAYTNEDPIKAILSASQTDPGTGQSPLNFSLLESADPNDITYNFTSNVNVGTDASGAVTVATPDTAATTGTDVVGYGTVGSIDHEFMSAGFKSDFTGADVWEINANETDAYDYGRYNDNATNFYYGRTQGNGIPSDVSYGTDLAQATPFRSSDHNPMVIGIDLPVLDDANATKVTDVQIVGVNDFHGRLVADSSDGGAAALAGAVGELRDQYGAAKTIFASGGDNVGASTFESFTAHDKPSLDALTTMGLDVSTVGNHEFDGQASLGANYVGWKDLVNRLMKPYDAGTNPWGPATSAKDPNGIPYLAANVTYSTDPDGSGPLQAGDTVAPPTKEISVTLDNGRTVKIGFVGTVTPDLTSLESPANLAGVHVDDEADTITAINHYADQLKANGDKIVVLLTHEGAASTDCSAMLGSGSSFAQELNGIDDNVDAVLSGHTHLEYSCTFPVSGWAGRSITSRPVMQAGSYANALDQLVYSFDGNGNPVDVTSNLVGVKGPVSTLFSAPDDPAVASIVSDAVSASAVIGAQTLGKLGGPFDRARLSDGTENRGGESTLGNEIAEIQRWATSDNPSGYVSAVNGPAQIAFMNPGGLRADLEGTNADGSGDLTYRTAANVQPFANELTNMTLTGAQIKQVLEEQWSRDNIDNAHANIPARPFLKLGISKGFSYTYHEIPDPVHSGATLGVVDQMWLNGKQIDLTKTYSVTVNSFLASGGDNFWELAYGTHQEDTEQTDLQAQVDFMKQYQSTPLPVDYTQHAVRVTFPAGAPATYSAGDTVSFALSSLQMTGPRDTQDTTLTIKDGSNVLGSGIPVTASNSTQPYDDRGNANVSVTLPSGIAGDQVLTVWGDQTGTRAAIIRVPGVKLNSTLAAADQNATYGSPGSLTATVSGVAAPGGQVTYSEGPTTLGAAAVASDGTATLSIPEVTLDAGTHTITASFTGSDALNDSSTTFTLTVAQATTSVQAGDLSGNLGAPVPLPVTVTSPGSAVPYGTVTVFNGTTPVGSGTLILGSVVVQVDTTHLSEGANGLTVSYSGTSDFASSGTSVVLTLAKSPSTTTAADQSATYGAAGSLTAKVTADVAVSGQVTFAEGSTVLGQAPLASDGTATLSIAEVTLGAGTHTITASYGGSDILKTSSTTFTLTVGKAPTTVAAANASGTIGTPVAVPVTVTSAATAKPGGTVRVLAGSTVVGTGTLSGGSVTIQVDTSGLVAGVNTVTVTYDGAPDFASSSKDITLTLAKKAQTITFAQPANTVFGAGNVALSASASSGLPVSLTSQTPSVCTITGSSAVIVGAGTCTVTASQSGSGTYLAATPVSRSFQVAKAPITITTKATSTVFSLLTLRVTYTTTVKSAVTGLPVAGIPVTTRFSSSGASAGTGCTAITNASGVATCTAGPVVIAVLTPFIATAAETDNYLGGTASGSVPLL